MRTPSGILHVVDFKTSQIVSNIQPKDYWGDKRHWEIKNNIDTLEFKVFDNTDHAATLMQQNLVLKEVRDGRIVPYVITEIEKDSDDRSMIAYASGEWVQLAKASIINPQKIEGKTVNEFIDMALVGTKWKRGKTEYAGFHTMTIDEFIDPLKFLKDIASLFELEIQYRTEVVGSQIVGRYVDMVKKRGRDTGKEVTLGKDLMGIKRIENSQNICTALLGFVKKEGGDFITISSINNGVPYLVDNDAFQRWNERGQHKFGFYTPETENQDMSPERLMTLMKTDLKKRVNTSVSYEVNAQSIGRVFGLAHELINEGDTIRIQDTGFTPKLYLEARVIAADESFEDPTQDKYVFGDYREIVDPNEELRKLYNKILASLGNKQEILDQLDKLIKETEEKADTAQKESEAAKTLAEKALENVENNTVDIIESANPPTANLKPNKTLWRDISKGKPGVLKIWTGMAWEELVPDYGDDVKELDERTAEFKTSLEGLSSDVKQLSITTTEQGKQILDANTKIEQTSQAIEAKVDIKQVEDYVGGIGEINWFRNTELRNDTKYWNISNPFAIVRDVDNKYRGSIPFKTIAEGNTNDVFIGPEQSVTEVSVGDTVVASAYFKTDNPTALDQGGALEIQFLKIDGTIIKQVSEEIKLLKNQWTRIVVSALAPEGTVKAKFRFYVKRNGTLWMAQPMFQLGSIPSSYLENPNDFVDKDKIIDDLADKVATEKYNQKVTELERSITANAEGVTIISEKHETFVGDTYDAYVKETGSKLQVLDEGILAQVKNGDIISAINQTAEQITIDVAKLNINADTIVKWLTAEGIDTNLIRISGDKITIDKNGVTVKMLDFLYEDERGTKTTVISKRNLIADHDFSSVQKKNIGHSDYWGFDGGYGLPWKANGNVIIEKNTSVFNYEQMVNAARVDMYNYPETTVKNGMHPGNVYTVSAHFRCATVNGKRVTAKPQLRVCYVTYRDNVHYDMWYEAKLSFDAPSTYYGDIQRRSFTFTVPNSYNPQENAVVIKVESEDANIGQGTAICVSGVTLVSGKYASMYDWDRAAAERASGLQPFNSISVGGVNNNIGPAPDGQTFDISTENEVKFFRNIRAVQGVNLGGNPFQGWGHIRFTDGNNGPGFYVNSANGWKFNALG
ncbi:phage tail spike protein [Bacillus cereus group sp. BfR-BA-01316]|uniref:phage tail spike protein n=1 Tax=Bacillus cereus group sp. BfR-BA-01316 TaxID=2920293 RepID=UPI001F56C5DF|nr:phage tail spike protein [Bacillus cereus group sp. BfR-BA-01316]